MTTEIFFFKYHAENEVERLISDLFLFFRGCLHVKFHPGMKLVRGWSHPCLRWNVSYCFHVFAEMKFHAGMKNRDEISSWDEKKKKRRVSTSSRDEILKWACFFNFWRIIQVCFPNSACLNITKVWI